MKVVNLFGGPGTGKSTTAAGLFFLMKLAKKETELINEYAKYLVWSDRVKMFREQGYVFEKQNHKMEILRDKVDYAITDSPIILSAIYGRLYNYNQTFEPYVFEKFDSYDNINIMLKRVKEYNPNGRNQTEEQAKDLDVQIKSLLEERGLPYVEVQADYTAPWEIFKLVTGEEHFTKVHANFIL